MPLQLGSAFPPRQVEVVEHEPHPEVTIESLRAEQLLVAIGSLREALAQMPAPVVHVAEPDLTAIVQAVTQLKGSASPEEIARAVVNEITPGGEPGMDTVLSKLTESLERLDFRLKGIGSGGGSSGVGVSDINDRVARKLGEVTVTNFPATQPVSGTVSVANGAKALVDAGVTYLAGGGVTTSAVTPNASLTLLNPTGSGRRVYVTEWSVYADASAEVAYFLDAVSSGTLVPITNGVLGGGTPSQTQVRIGSGVLTGGTWLSPTSRVNNQAPVLERGRTLRVDPGRSVTLRFMGPGATNEVDFNVGWYETGLT